MAISASSYGVGNRIYKGATSAPTRGRVDPTGYVNRELNNVASNARSGIAASALRRLRSPSRMGSAPPPPGPPQVQSAVGRSGPIGASIGQTLRTSPIGKLQVQYPSNPSNSGGGYMRTMDFRDSNGDGRDDRGTFDSRTGAWSNGANGQGPARQGNGQSFDIGFGMQPKSAPAPDPITNSNRGPVGLPFDAEAADAQENLLGQRNRFFSDYAEQQKDLNRQWEDARKSLDDERPGNERALLENYAGRGLAYSSGYAHDTGELQREYSNRFGRLDRERQGGFDELSRQLGLFEGEYGTNLAQIQKAAARKAAERAAELEFETPTAEPTPNIGGPADVFTSPVNAPAVPTPVTPMPQIVPDEPTHHRPIPVAPPVAAPPPVTGTNNRGGILGGPFKRPGLDRATGRNPVQSASVPAGSFQYTMPNGKVITAKDTPTNRKHIANKGWKITGDKPTSSAPVVNRRKRR